VLINGAPVDPKVQHVVAVGATIELKTPGGGGYGLATLRDGAHVNNDIENGYVNA
jgi:N-methylhydantoinase B